MSERCVWVVEREKSDKSWYPVRSFPFEIDAATTASEWNAVKITGTYRVVRYVPAETK